jgi:hypothetical protein
MNPLVETPVVVPSAPANPKAPAQPATASVASTSGRRKPRCEDCFFFQNMLCALPDRKPCPTFRPAHPDGLRPPRQLSFVFRQERPSEPFLFQPAGA